MPEPASPVPATPAVLIADDDPSIVAALRFLVGKAGYAVRVATDGAAAMAAIAADPPDLVLLDLMMPGMSGYDICAAIRRDAALRHLRVIMLTAKGFSAERARGLEAGADEYITKPFSTRHIMERIAHHLARPAARQGTQPGTQQGTPLGVPRHTG